MSRKFKQTLTCVNCGKKIEVEYDFQQATLWKERRGFVQDIFPEWTAEQRELLLSGLCSECFNQIAKED